MTLQISCNVITSDETYRKLAVNTFPESETFHMKELEIGEKGAS